MINSLPLIDGLPYHPLIVHAAVILLPLAAIFMLVLAASPKARNLQTYITLFILSGFGTLAALAAESTGKDLSNVVGYPAKHAQLGEIVVDLSFVFLLLITAWLVSQRKDLDKFRFAEEVRNLSAWLATLAGVGLTVSIVLAGHSGAEATWSNRIAMLIEYSVEDTETDSNADSNTIEEREDEEKETLDLPAQIPSVVTDELGLGKIILTREFVAEHFDRPKYCWTIVEERVYNLTEYVDRHPGGREEILNLCGVDGTAAFTQKHDGDIKPGNILETYFIADLNATADLSNYDLPKSLRP
jgi:cytochrome b involved in lipid metabolism